MAKSKPRKPPRPTAGPDFTTAAESPDYRRAVADLGELCGGPRRRMRDPAGGFTFHLDPGKQKSFKLDQVHTDFLNRGCYVFDADPVAHHRVGILPTRD